MLSSGGEDVLPPTNSAELTYLRAKLASWPKFSNLVFATAKLHSEGFSVLFLDLVEGVNVNTCFRFLKAVWGRGWDFGAAKASRLHLRGPVQSSISRLMSSVRALEFPRQA